MVSPNDSRTPLATTGERLMTDNRSENVPEHLHRYALACRLASGVDTLDIACGEGYGTNLLASHAASVVGVDVSADAIAHASQKYKRSGLRFLHGSATAIRRVLRPGGKLIMSSPDKRFYSDATGHRNQYHLRELYCDEFRALISRYFQHTQMMYQRMSYGSMIVPEHPERGFDEYRGDFSGFTVNAELQEAMYNIAVASDGPLKNLPISFWDGMGRLQDLEANANQAHQQLRAVRKSFAMRVARAVTAPLSLFRMRSEHVTAVRG